ncbi:BTB/POZ domain-containing protein 19 isoform X5 [Monodelphis domestica]|uniref:BTB/POZ domain-containing protein 19 isoform X5 n=1 Tax=Monodelphis domestica TaxID=13616 RepID=UPI0024E21DDC|nr:BTB/POZ domain-containing protein 19 isoform X5 [Monodelphis domestica]
MGQAAPSAPEKLSSGAGEPPGGGASRRAGPSDQERPSSPGVTGSDAGQAIQCFRAGSSGGGRLGLAGAWAPHAGGNSSTYLNSGRPRARSRSRQEGLRSRTRGRLRASSSGSASASGTGSGLALASKTAWAMAPPGGGALAPGHTHLMQGDPATFRSALRGLLNCTRFSDVRFVVGQDRREVLAHRCVLTSRCDYFRQLLGTELPDKGCQEEPVVLADVPAEAFLTVLEFLYTNSITLDRRTVLEVMISSLEYGLSELRELCVEFVVQNLDVELVCEALQVAVTFGLRLLRDRCLNFIDCHAQAVLEQPMVEVAQSVVGELRLPLLNASELSTLEEQNRVEPFIPVEQIAEAWKCHALRGGESIRTSSSLGRRRKGTTPREHHYYLESS